MRSTWERRVIPRWRSSSISARLSENLPVIKRKNLGVKVPSQIHAEVTEKVNRWRYSPTLGVAADLLNYAHVEEVREILKEPAHYIRNFPELSHQILSVAKHVLGVDEYPEYGKTPYIYNEIARLKKHLRVNPRDAVACIDLARHYAVNNQASHARRLILTSLDLARDNRFILRSASRFYLNLHDPDRSLHILKNSDRTAEDPWLLASMISVETILDKPPKYFRRAKAMVESKRFAPVHLAELSATLATLHLNTGNLKNARKLFNVSLTNPNDNTVAQAVWAANEFSMSLAIDPAWFSNDFSSEASYYALEKTGDYRNALKAAREWFEDEPFSIRPLQAGSFVASILGEFKIAEDLIRQALLLDPYCIDAKNNLVFALTAQNKTADAIELLNEICLIEMKNNDELSGHTLANRGMLYYRLFDIENGHKNYLRSISKFEREKSYASRDVAIAYWAKEALLASDEKAGEIFLHAKKVIGQDSFAAKLVFASMTQVTEKEKDKIENSIVQISKLNSIKTWEYDKSKNTLIMSRRDPFKT